MSLFFCQRGDTFKFQADSISTGCFTENTAHKNEWHVWSRDKFSEDSFKNWKHSLEIQT